MCPILVQVQSWMFTRHSASTELQGAPVVELSLHKPWAGVWVGCEPQGVKSAVSGYKAPGTLSWGCLLS